MADAGDKRRAEAALPANWLDLDLVRCFAEYTRHCREAHLRGEPVADLFRPKGGREAAR